MRGKLYTCDLICWGTPSPAAFQEFLGMVEGHTGKKVVAYAHRGSGRKVEAGEAATLDDGTVAEGSQVIRAWSRVWYRRLCRESCYRCGYHSTVRPGDLTIGDWWGLDRFAPGLDDRWGVSCVITSTPRGLALLREASRSLELIATPVSDVANSSQPMLIHPPERRGRDVFWSVLYSKGFEAACRSVGAIGLALTAKSLLRKVSSFKGNSSKGADEAAVSKAWERAPKVDYDKLEAIGEYPIGFAARNRDDGIRRNSSSGGMFRAIADHVINDLDGVVYGCAFDEDLHAVHIRCETISEVERCMGSKYSQSDMEDSIRMVRADLGEGRTVLFTGTPCQVAAVRATCSERSERNESL